jgi:hypothetical protein
MITIKSKSINADSLNKSHSLGRIQTEYLLKGGVCWSGGVALRDLVPEDAGLYFICLKDGIDREAAKCLQRNIILNNSDFWYRRRKDGDLEKSLFNLTKKTKKKQGSTYLELQSGSGRSALVLRDLKSDGEGKKLDIPPEDLALLLESAMKEIPLKSRIIKIGVAAGRRGIYGRLRSYANIQASITRLVLATKNHESLAWHFLKASDCFSISPDTRYPRKNIESMLAGLMEKEFIAGFRKANRGFPPPWEQEGREADEEPTCEDEDASEAGTEALESGESFHGENQRDDSEMDTPLFTKSALDGVLNSFDWSATV